MELYFLIVENRIRSIVLKTTSIGLFLRMNIKLGSP